MRRLLRATAIAALVLGVVVGEGGRATAGRESLFIGLDTSGAFYRAGHEDALAFLAHYIYGHLQRPWRSRHSPLDLFIRGALGGDESGRDASLAGKTMPRSSRRCASAPAHGHLTNFNVFFRRVARIAAERQPAPAAHRGAHHRRPADVAAASPRWAPGARTGRSTWDRSSTWPRARDRAAQLYEPARRRAVAPRWCRASAWPPSATKS